MIRLRTMLVLLGCCLSVRAAHATTLDELIDKTKKSEQAAGADKASSPKPDAKIKAEDDLEAAPQASASAAPALVEVVRGAYVEMRSGIGYTVLGKKVGNEVAAEYPQVPGQSESLGVGAAVDLALGYEFTDGVALQLLGGVALANSRRQDYVRGIGITYGGLGLRLQIPLRDRLHMILAPGIAYARSDNAVERPTVGMMVVGSAGFEYYAHVRHFSLGADLSVLAPLTPLRIFVAVMPHIKYTF